MNGELRLPGIGRRQLATSFTSIGGGPARTLSLCSSLALLGSFLLVPYHVTDVVGDVRWLTAFVAAAFLLATALALVLPESVDLPVGIALGLGIFLAGLGGYLLSIPDVYYALFTVQRVYVDTVALLAGQSVLLLLNADLWAVGIAPGPVFLTWYFALRRHYELAAISGGITLGFFALTGDADATTTVVGMTGVLGTLGFGSIDRWDGSWEQLQDLGLVLVGAIVAARLLGFVPDGRESASDVLGQGETLEGTLVGAPGQVPIVGSITLSPSVRFTVEADRGDYWRVASFDRYTGEGWISTADVSPYRDPLPGPPGEAEEIVQEFEAEARSRAMPAAWKPILVEESWADRTVVADDGGFQPVDSISAGDSYRVVSRRPMWSEAVLRESERAYPRHVRERYLQLPDSTPDRLVSLSREVAGDVDAPYDAMINLRDWLESEKSYSLQVPRAGNDAADRFVFDFDAGYCTHFATALTVMLRTIGVPARFVVGYSTGEQIEENRYRVRGLHSHAWTEVFFPEAGWVTVDPTPSEPRDETREQRLERAGEGTAASGTATPTTEVETTPSDGGGNRSDPGSSPGPSNGTPFPQTRPDDVEIGRGPDVDPRAPGTVPPYVDQDAPNRSNFGATTPGGEPDGRSNGDRLTLLAGAVGVALGAYRVGLLERAYRAVWIRGQATTDSPGKDVELAFERLEYVLSREYRDRDPDETPRAYVRSLEDANDVAFDERLHRVVELYEQVRYSDERREERAAEAVRLVDELIEER